jgi:hypothetical protein
MNGRYIAAIWRATGIRRLQPSMRPVRRAFSFHGAGT